MSTAEAAACADSLLVHNIAVFKHYRPARLPAICSLQVKLITAADCQLAVSIYPKFAYNASSGGGSGTVQQVDEDKLQIKFDTNGETTEMDFIHCRVC